MTPRNQDSRKRKRDETNDTSEAASKQFVSNFAEIITIASTNNADSSRILVHKDLILKSSPKLRDEVEAHGFGGMIRQSPGMYRRSRRFVHFLYTNTLAAVGHEYPEWREWIADWDFGCGLRSAKYMNKIMDELIALGSEEPDVLPEIVMYVRGLEEATGNNTYGPLWHWLRDAIGNVITAETYAEMTDIGKWPARLLACLLQSALQRAEHPSRQHRLPTYAMRYDYHVDEEEEDEEEAEDLSFENWL
ncbi:hypothetical protein Slin15195_G039230 [Septoria linicola]|uniref:Uncharacterized protein n=1 Tax=Septoria linicola TaxID=215465 RepID=A0A9Q9AM47_9PEZI|nr:hypothetical protein Slin14017_G120650 [Septoria linicola]USW50604.1 hypothetical protein Slin15195_G039230 [Septoria linicola]